MTVLNEARHAGEHVLSEANGNLSRENIVIKAGAGILTAGTVLGKIAPDKGAVTVGNPAFTGTGNGVLTKASPAYGAAVQEGTYIVRLIEAGADAGQFEVIRPDGSIDGHATVGVAYDGQVKFTIADGSTDFSAAAQFTLAVSIADPTGVGKYAPTDLAATDGSASAAGVLFAGVDATSADVAAVAHVRAAEVNGNCLAYHASIDDAGKKATKVAELKALGIIVR